MKRYIVIFMVCFFLLNIQLVSANIVCNDGTVSPTCTDCHRGCCSHHNGCSSSGSYTNNSYNNNTTTSNHTNDNTTTSSNDSSNISSDNSESYATENIDSNSVSNDTAGDDEEDIDWGALGTVGGGLALGAYALGRKRRKNR